MNYNNMETSLNKILEKRFRENWDCPALSDYRGTTFYYRDVARKIEKLHIVFEMSGLKKGDKVAICGKNQSNWGVVFLASITYGAVAVPILSEFKSGNIHHIVNHSEATVLFIGGELWDDLAESQMPNLQAVIRMSDFSVLYSKKAEIDDTREHLNELFGRKYPKNFRPEHITYHIDEPEELAMINYTSGTTGFSKGVMIPYRAILSNVLFAWEVHPQINNRSNLVSMLPVAHMYGMMFEFIFPITVGAHVHFLTKVPSPKVLLDAFSEVKPDIIISVPLVIEKIYKKKLQPLISKTSIRVLLRLPVIEQKIKRKIQQELIGAFGGRFAEVIIGGAAFNKEAEAFFKKIEFPFTVGYGMTECAPIITYAPWNKSRLYSCGQKAPRMEIRIDSYDPERVPGEILCKGDNVMLGYYRNEEATAAVFTEDGWLKTGDMGIIDKDGFLYIRGRSKTMILGSSGQNIYPEEIESLLNNMPYVIESLVVEQEKQLIALIYSDLEQFELDALDGVSIENKMEENRLIINQELPNYAQIAKIRIVPEEFEKTPKRSIKRFLYQSNNL